MYDFVLFNFSVQTYNKNAGNEMPGRISKKIRQPHIMTKAAPQKLYSWYSMA